MKTKLILLDNPIIVSDEKIEVGDYYFWDENKNGAPSMCTNSETEEAIVQNTDTVFYKVIAGIEGLPTIDFNGLEGEFGWVDVEKLVKDIYGDGYGGIDQRYAFIEGFKKAQSLIDKKFSEEDILQAIQLGREKEKFNFETNRSEHKYSYAEIIKLLQQPKVFDVEIEMEFDYKSNGYSAPYKLKPKITNNSIKILKKL